MTTSIWDGVIGQQRAVARLQRCAQRPVHAYLFVGPAGSSKSSAARAFAARLMSGGDDPGHRDARLALAGAHPDVREMRRTGASFQVDEISEMIRIAAMAPVESTMKILVLHEFHLVNPQQVGKLLKTIEEPPAGTVFVILAEQVPDEFVTIASRCVRIEFGPADLASIEATLAAEGHDPVVARAAASASAGNVDRARVLATDDGLAGRLAAFRSMPARLDGTGATACILAAEISGLADQAAAFLGPVHETELRDLEARVAVSGERGSGRKAMEDRHKREVRRYRTDELRSGLSTMAGAYRDALGEGTTARPDAAVRAVSRIHQALEALDRNPNEALLLQCLLLELPSLSAATLLH